MSTMTGTRTHTVLASPIGPLTVVAADGALCGLYFPAHKRLPDPETFGRRTDDGFDAVRDQLAAYFAGDLTEFDLPLAPRGTDFQQRVWEQLRGIGYGETASYGEVAHRLGMTNAASRAVGLANGRNPIPIVIPCHRVIGANGTLTGYAGGLPRKQTLLELEQDALF